MGVEFGDGLAVGDGVVEDGALLEETVGSAPLALLDVAGNGFGGVACGVVRDKGSVRCDLGD